MGLSFSHAYSCSAKVPAVMMRVEKGSIGVSLVASAVSWLTRSQTSPLGARHHDGIIGMAKFGTNIVFCLSRTARSLGVAAHTVELWDLYHYVGARLHTMRWSKASYHVVS
jgi:hypothetical protein